jgi:gamma-glutamylcyclotransferase (GGCT)/AIG2-like uncharacterized protein YtfP
MPRVFVYGTLRPGQPRWPALARFISEPDATRAASVPGQLFDTGYGWPAAIFEGTSIDQVLGVVVRLDPESVDEALLTLDAIEGVDSGLFQRVIVTADGHPCWSYHWPGPTEGFQRIPGWC